SVIVASRAEQSASSALSSRPVSLVIIGPVMPPAEIPNARSAATHAPSKYFASKTFSERIEIFQDYFNRDVETWFTSSVACCDLCLEDFSKVWPGTVAHDKALEEGAISVKQFIDGGRIRDDFYPDEITELLEYIYCPYCNEV